MLLIGIDLALASLLATLSIAIACPSHPRNRDAYEIEISNYFPVPAPCLLLASIISIVEEYNKVDGKPDCSIKCVFNIPSTDRRLSSLANRSLPLTSEETSFNTYYVLSLDYMKEKVWNFPR